MEQPTTGRHRSPDPSQDRLSWSGGNLVRPAIFLVGVVVAVGAAVWRWAVTTPLLGAHMPTAAHVTLVAAFLVAVLLALVFGTRWSHRRLSCWSEARRARKRDHRQAS